MYFYLVNMFYLFFLFDGRSYLPTTAFTFQESLKTYTFFAVKWTSKRLNN